MTAIAQESVGIGEWFGLRRDNFILDPRNNPDDRAFYATRTSVNIVGQITSLELDLGAKIAPKKLYWGPYGSGKTHTLYKVQKELGDRVEIYPVFVECPTVKRNSTFTLLYEKTLNEMGMDHVLKLFRSALNDVARKVGVGDPEEIVRKLSDMVHDEDLARAIYQLTQPQSYFDPMWLWRWVTASGISSKDKVQLRVTGDLKTADPEKLANILITLGALTKNYLNKTQVLVFDELDRARDLTPEAQATFSTAFTRLCDPNQTDVSIFLSNSADRLAQLPGIISSPVQSRLGAENIVEIPPMGSQEVDAFIRDLVTHARNPRVNTKEFIKKAKVNVTEDLPEDFFPFSKQSIDAIKVKLSKNIVPREIGRVMSRSASYAKTILKQKAIVTKAVQNS